MEVVANPVAAAGLSQTPGGGWEESRQAEGKKMAQERTTLQMFPVGRGAGHIRMSAWAALGNCGLGSDSVMFDQLQNFCDSVSLTCTKKYAF